MDNNTEKSKWNFNFKREEMTEKDNEYYLSFKIKGMYTGQLMPAGAYWIADREKKMYVIENEYVGPRLREDGTKGPSYDNFIYKDKIGHIANEYTCTRTEFIYKIKDIVLDKSFKNEEEYLLEAIRRAYIAEVEGFKRICIIEEFPPNIQFV